MGRKTSKKSANIVWCDRGWFPAYIGFCPSKKAWDREMRSLGIDDEAYPTTHAKCTMLQSENTGKTRILVTVSEEFDRHDDCLAIIGLIVHEAAHVWQYICDDAGDDHPSKEAEAYAMQNITMSLISAYADTRSVKVVA